MRASTRARVVPWLLAGLFYVALTLTLTWPLAARLTTVLPHDLGDPVLNTWILWWNAHTLPLTARWWNAPIFWPAPGAIAFSEHLLGLSVLATPLQWMGAGPVATYNTMFLLSFPLSALAAHALAFSRTGRHDAALVAGLVFGFNPFRIAHFPQLQVLASYWMPVALLALHRYAERLDSRWLGLFGAAWLLQALSNGYYLVFFPALLALWVAWFVRADARRLGAIAATWLIASLPLAPLLWKYRQIHAAFGLRRGFGDAEFFGADLTALLDASPLLRFWKLSAFHRPEGELFPGLTACLLVALVLVVALWTAPRPDGHSKLFKTLLAVSVVLVVVALSPHLFGPWSLSIAGVKLLSVAASGKPLSLGLLSFAVAMALEPRVVAAWRARSTLAFYVLATMAMYLLSFGPRARFLGETFIYRAPYAWLFSIPGFDAVRVPARFAMLALVCLSAAAAIAFARLTERLNRGARAIAAAVVVAGVVADGWILAMPLPHVPARFAALESLPPGTSVLELPLGGNDEDTAAMYRSIFHGRPVVNGYSGYSPRHYDILRLALDNGDEAAIDAMASRSPLAVVVGTDRGADRFLPALARRAGVVSLGVEPDRRLFLIPAAGLARADPGSQPLEIQSVSANGRPVERATVTDGNLVSRWDSGAPQRGTETVTIDLGAITVVRALTLALGPYIGNYPRTLEIEASEDGLAWTACGGGAGAGRAVDGALQNIREVPVSYVLRPTRARFLRLRQLGTDPQYHWSIAELAIFGQ